MKLLWEICSPFGRNEPVTSLHGLRSFMSAKETGSNLMRSIFRCVHSGPVGLGQVSTQCQTKVYNKQSSIWIDCSMNCIQHKSTLFPCKECKVAPTVPCVAPPRVVCWRIQIQVFVLQIKLQTFLPPPYTKCAW